MSFFTYKIRLNKVFKKEGASEYFTPSEIVNATVNLVEAERGLSTNEFFFVSVVYEFFNKMKNKLLLNKSGFMGLCNEMTAHFDLVAPYYKFCGDSNVFILMAIMDEEKKPFRKLAKIVIDKEGIFSPKWMQLHQKFMEEFYPEN